MANEDYKNGEKISNADASNADSYKEYKKTSKNCNGLYKTQLVSKWLREGITQDLINT